MHGFESGLEFQCRGAHTYSAFTEPCGWPGRGMNFNPLYGRKQDPEGEAAAAAAAGAPSNWPYGPKAFIFLG